MSRIRGKLLDVVGRLLEADEREVVCGDLTEARATSSRALLEVMGLVLRRQIALWTDWRPWLALCGIVMPLGVLLSFVARSSAEVSAVRAFLFLNNFRWAYLGYPGWRQDFLAAGASTALNYATLTGWAWTSGVALGALSRRAVWANGSLFVLLVFGEYVAVSQFHNPFNAVVFASRFYDDVLPILLRTVLVVIPAVAGMRFAQRHHVLPFVLILMVAGALTVMTTVEARRLNMQADWPLRLMPFLLMWPTAYILTRASWRRAEPYSSNGAWSG